MRTATRFALLTLLGLHSLLANAADFATAQLRSFPQDKLAIVHEQTTHSLQIWLADTPERQQQGLMFLTELPPGYGRLFPLDTPRVMTMWMKNTYVSLDMVFIGTDGRIVRIAANTEPLSTNIISSGSVIGGVLEIRAGESKRLGLREGDRVLHGSFATR